MAPATSRRRPRSESEDEEDADIIRRSQSSSPSSSSGKRARTNGYHSDSSEGSATDEGDEVKKAQRRRGTQGSHGGPISYGLNGEAGEDGFHPGAIVRVKVTNFVTYEKAEFFPGPNLNMVIGPNGTGKSSLVCAICLGLGWGPQHLGRAGQVGEFVKHGANVAEVEIELQRRPQEAENHVVRVRIIRDGNGREWWLNGRKASLKAVQALTRSLSIQIDNLCQFLPQDKVSEFAALSPVELLQQTQRAAAPEEMLEWHASLKKYRQGQKTLEQQFETDKETLQNLERRQENLRAEVERLQERNKVQEKIELLQKTIPFVEYKIARAEHMEFRQKKADAQQRLRDLESQVAPTLESVNQKEQYGQQITAVVYSRKQQVAAAERTADTLLAKIETLDDNIKTNEGQMLAESQSENQRKRELQNLQGKIANLKAQLNNPTIEFDPAEWNERIRAKEQRIRSIDTESIDLQARERELKRLGGANRQQQEEAEQEIGEFDSQAGQMMNKVRAVSPETAQAWKWIQEHQDEFEKEVYGPPLISCSIKDPQYTNTIESLLSKNDYMSITAQTTADRKKLSDQLYGAMKLGDVTLRSAYAPLSDQNYSRVMSKAEMERCGLQGWAIDFVDGPEPVLAMLCDSARIHMAGVSLQEVSDDQFDMLVNSRCNTWITGKHFYKVNNRAEYGPQATSTTTRLVTPGRYWTDRPVDSSRRREIESRRETLEREFLALKEEIIPLRSKITQLKKDRDEVQREIEDLQKEKAIIQKAKGEQRALPAKLQREEEALEEKRRTGLEHRARIKTLQTQHDHLILRKAKAALEHKDQVTQIRQCHEELLEAEIRLIEAKSDSAALKERNGGIHQRLEEERQLVEEAKEASKRCQAAAREALEVCTAITAEAQASNTIDYFQTIAPDLTVQGVEDEIAAETARLDHLHAHNPNVIRDFEKRQQDVEKLNDKISETGEKLTRISARITKIRSKWEPELDKLIAEISDAFSYNFEQIGCAGEVSVHKDEDFENWAIQIKVKFRENEPLQILDSHRQSGGERSVSTIFYLMALQSLARSPFRVVDEINQGMDPRNERMVHERMVEIACKEHTSQYFLITPKLLTGLRYDRRMRVLCIASGEFMPEEGGVLDLKRVLASRRRMIAAV